MADVVIWLQRSLIASAGTIVFGMEDGTVSIFGLIFGVAATTSSNAIVLIAGASGATAAAVAMSAGAYLDAATRRDAILADPLSRAEPPKPIELAGWMLIADFLSASVPILPFVFLSMFTARIIAALATVGLLVGLGVGRGWIAGRNLLQTTVETVLIGVTAAMAGVGTGLLINYFTLP
jgi:VIT1/CCC1 family predicted Fe2+/Mn2+ transporter